MRLWLGSRTSSVPPQAVRPQRSLSSKWGMSIGCPFRVDLAGEDASSSPHCEAAEPLPFAGVHLAGCRTRDLLQARVLSTRERNLQSIVSSASTQAAAPLDLSGPEIPACIGTLLVEGLSGLWAALPVALWKSDHTKYLGSSILEISVVRRARLTSTERGQLLDGGRRRDDPPTRPGTAVAPGASGRCLFARRG
jgi:hypothetical protein